jgi:hypothetical protein
MKSQETIAHPIPNMAFALTILQVGTLFGITPLLIMAGQMLNIGLFFYVSINGTIPTGSNSWYNGAVGNYWADYEARYPGGINNGLAWTEPYEINGTTQFDRFPLVRSTGSFLNMRPAISNPMDISYVFGEAGHEISWTITDRTLTTTSYVVYKNGVLLISGNWTPGQLITIDVDDLDIGTYNFTIVASDGLGGTVQDMVLVQVQLDPTLVLTLIIIGIGVACVTTLLTVRTISRNIIKRKFTRRFEELLVELDACFTHSDFSRIPEIISIIDALLLPGRTRARQSLLKANDVKQLVNRYEKTKIDGCFSIRIDVLENLRSKKMNSIHIDRVVMMPDDEIAGKIAVIKALGGNIDDLVSTIDTDKPNE